jgi:hypothetical protein
MYVGHSSPTVVLPKAVTDFVLVDHRTGPVSSDNVLEVCVVKYTRSPHDAKVGWKDIAVLVEDVQDAPHSALVKTGKVSTFVLVFSCFAPFNDVLTEVALCCVQHGKGESRLRGRGKLSHSTALSGGRHTLCL